MDQHEEKVTRPVNPRRRKRSQMQIFKESYLPVLIAGAALLLIFVFIIGSVARGIQTRKAATAASIEASIAAQEELDRLNMQADALLEDAAILAARYDYAGAVAKLDSFSGDMAQFEKLVTARQEYVQAQDQMVAWNDPAQVRSLSFQLLIADTQRAFTNAAYGTAYNRNFVTTGEFSEMLEQLYANGYVLVSLDDFLTTETTDTGAVIYKAKTLYLPAGKKPLLLTQTNVNYNTYMIDGDGDKFPDKDGAGFASRLIIGENGKLTCQMVDSSGSTVTGAFDLVPILDAFVESHPDFSYRGAKAILAVTGYDGLFGYRTYAKARDYFGVSTYEQDVNDVKAVIKALRDSGYDIACYTYENVAYGKRSATQIQADLSGWIAEVMPILGNVDIFAFAQVSDLTDKATAYTGDAYNTLYNTGFRYFLGFCDDGKPWATVTDDYVRIGRILVTGSNMAYHADWFSGMFDASSLLDPTRGEVPN